MVFLLKVNTREKAVDGDIIALTREKKLYTLQEKWIPRYRKLNFFALFCMVVSQSRLSTSVNLEEMLSFLVPEAP